MTIINALLFVVLVLVGIYSLAKVIEVMTRVLVYPFMFGCGIVLLVSLPIYNLIEPWLFQWQRYGWRGVYLRVAGISWSRRG